MEVTNLSLCLEIITICRINFENLKLLQNVWTFGIMLALYKL